LSEGGTVLQGKPVCVALNKQDLLLAGGAVPPLEGLAEQQGAPAGEGWLEQQLQELCMLRQGAGGRPLRVLHTSAVSGAGTQKLAEWLGSGGGPQQQARAQQAGAASSERGCVQLMPVGARDMIPGRRGHLTQIQGH
jgi:hypothetical protein